MRIQEEGSWGFISGSRTLGYKEWSQTAVLELRIRYELRLLALSYKRFAIWAMLMRTFCMHGEEAAA